MNLEKARDFFSAYYEETLESGLKQSFEQRLSSDKQLQSEYQSFVETMSELDELKFEEIPVPAYLNARITARIEEVRVPVSKPKGLVFYLPRLGFAAAAALAIVGSVAEIGRFTKSNTAHAGFFSSSDPAAATKWPLETIQISGSGSSAVLNYCSATDRVVKVFDRNGQLLQSFTAIANEPLKADLANPNNPQATMFEIQVSDGGPDQHVAIPGTASQTVAPVQSGNLNDFALALADRFRSPVIVDSKSTLRKISWNMDYTDVKSVADRAFDGLPFQEVQTSTGILSLKDK